MIEFLCFGRVTARFCCFNQVDGWILIVMLFISLSCLIDFNL